MKKVLGKSDLRKVALLSSLGSVAALSLAISQFCILCVTVSLHAARRNRVTREYASRQE